MRTQVEKPKIFDHTSENKSRSLRQAPISKVLQAYTKNMLQRQIADEGGLLQRKTSSIEKKKNEEGAIDIIQRKRKSDGSIIKEIPIDKYPESIGHIEEYLKGSEQDFTLDRTGASKRRRQSLKGIPTKSGYDRDEFPMAMFSEGGTGASVKYIDPSDNRGAGSMIGHSVSNEKDGEQIIASIVQKTNGKVLQL